MRELLDALYAILNDTEKEIDDRVEECVEIISTAHVAESFDDLIKLGQETEAGSVRSVSRRSDGTPVLVRCVYFECPDLPAFLDDLDRLEDKHGFGR